MIKCPECKFFHRVGFNFCSRIPVCVVPEESGTCPVMVTESNAARGGVFIIMRPDEFGCLLGELRMGGNREVIQ